MPTQIWSTTPTANDDFLIGGNGNTTFDGGSGDDFILGDAIQPFLTGTTTSALSPANIDNSAKWTTGENPFITDPTVPYTSLYVSTVAGQKAYSSVTVGAGETIAIDIDFGYHAIGVASDLMVILLDQNGNQVAIDDDYFANAEAGSVYSLDSFLTYTNNSGVSQTYTIVFQEYGSADGNTFEGDETFVANISVTGHAATGSFSAGNDTLTGGIGDDTLAGQAGADTLSGGDGNDDLFGGSGNDSIDGGAGFDTAWYGDASSAVNVDLRVAAAQNTGGAGTDTLANVENLVGSRYSDSLFGTDGSNNIRGGAGGDSIYGYGSNDSLGGEDGDDTIYGGDGDDSIYGDRIDYSVWFNNTLYGGAGNDYIVAWRGNDTVYGGEGNDTLVDGGGNDILAGGIGTDWLYYYYASGPVTVDLTVTAAQNTGGAGIDTITGIEYLYGSSYNDTITGNGANNILEGAYGNDVLNGGGGNDTLTGDDGDDTLNGGSGTDTATYQNTYSTTSAGVIVDLNLAGAQNTVNAGMDTLVSIERVTGSNYDDQLSGTSVANTLDGGNGNDFLNGRGGNDLLKGGEGDDVLLGGSGDDMLGGGNGKDTASYVGATSAVTVNLTLAGAQNTGGAGNDTLVGIENLIGSGFGDSLTGSAVINVLEGRAGNDTLTGGAGADQFRFNTALNAATNVDNIADFQHNLDKIELDDAIFAAAGPLGTLSAGAFYTGTAAHDVTDRIIYDPATGNIYYDADGNGAGAAILFAHVTAGVTLSNTDFQII